MNLSKSLCADKELFKNIILNLRDKIINKYKEKNRKVSVDSSLYYGVNA
jgi:hypothetical protein